MDVYQCPVCELRFRNASEMDAHIESDHPKFRAERSAVDDAIASAHQRRRDPTKRFRPDEDA
jgi:hypothetical protein